MSKETNTPTEKLFGSKTRAKLLRLFFENPEKSFYVREMTRVIDEQINSVRRELLNLESIGIIKNDTLIGVLEGPPKTPFENGYLLFKILFTDYFPFRPPHLLPYIILTDHYSSNNGELPLPHQSVN